MPIISLTLPLCCAQLPLINDASNMFTSTVSKLQVNIINISINVAIIIVVHAAAAVVVVLLLLFIESNTFSDQIMQLSQSMKSMRISQADC
jgi:hypothetical protein